MKIEVYVDRLFQDYEDTQELRDFKEEIIINLQERIKELENKGLSPEEAFDKAVAELGDITAIADQISKQKRKEIIGQMYVGQKVPMDMLHAVGFVVCGGAVLFGVLAALVVYASNGRLSDAIASVLPFLSIPAAGLVFLWLTQETPREYPMAWQRAAVYALAGGAVVFGLVTACMLYFMEGIRLEAVFGTMMMFVLPGLCVGAFLFLTEKDRRKPWAVEEERIWAEYYRKKYGEPAQQEQRGLLSGALWIFTAAVFVVLGFTIGFNYAWVVFLFALAGELLIEYWVRIKA